MEFADLIDIENTTTSASFWEDKMQVISPELYFDNRLPQIDVAIFSLLNDEHTKEIWDEPIIQDIASEEEPVTEIVKEDLAQESLEQPIIQDIASEEEPVAEIVKEDLAQYIASEEEPVAEIVKEELSQEMLEQPVIRATASEEEPIVQGIEQEAAVVNEHIASKDSHIPKFIFLVPYRDREQHLAFFQKHMKTILEDYSPQEYAIYYIHQCDQRAFNRGAMKNIGFLMVKNKYPDHYRNITLVFNDVDCVPTKKNQFPYITVPGTIKHFYGFKFTLGGIVSINAGDFEKLNGFPNFWAWGYEDNMLQHRAVEANLVIDRKTFFEIKSPAIIHTTNNNFREVNRGEFHRYLRKTSEGIYSITQLDYTIDETTHFVNVKGFFTGQNPDVTQYKLHDLRNGPMPFDSTFGLMKNNGRFPGASRFSMNFR